MGIYPTTAITFSWFGFPQCQWFRSSNTPGAYDQYKHWMKHFHFYSQHFLPRLSGGQRHQGGAEIALF